MTQPKLPAQYMIAGALDLLQKRSHGDRIVGQSRETFMRIMLPYQVDDSGVVLNRDYKPLGVHTRDRVRYVDFGNWVIPDDRLDFSVNEHGRHMFNDGDAPWLTARHFERYVDRVRRVFDL
ncbi:hypothetical protein [Tritonibacter mobilis]|uniref:hypothetical protein n=1 Tax=Tritonibacter mobilis TaxID=379347 RepID=UPI000806A505|nr:hypothetical protein [Tritonibacter mobilis]